ncbi:MAG: helix-turn-helix transcriptional regulator [Clostridia bacterium]|nr:helix-turn-helix transcriptional regulator [Clostridia bacterium]
MDAVRDIIIKDILVIVCKKETSDFSYTCNERVGAGFLIILSGGGTFSCGEYKRNLKVGDVLFVDKTDKYKVDAGENGMEYMTSAFILEANHSFRQYGVPYCINVPSAVNTALTLSGVWEKRSENYLFEIRKILYEILFEGLRIEQNSKKRRNSYHKIYPAIEYINKNYKEEINYEELASLCMFSPSHFRKIFVKEMGVPPTVYRENIRCEVAKGMLISDIFTVTEISEVLGYCDIYHFSKEFKKRTGRSPSAYKKSYLES